MAQEVTVSPVDRERCHFFNCFFWKKLVGDEASTGPPEQQARQAVRQPDKQLGIQGRTALLPGAVCST